MQRGREEGMEEKERQMGDIMKGKCVRCWKAKQCMIEREREGKGEAGESKDRQRGRRKEGESLMYMKWDRMKCHQPSLVPFFSSSFLPLFSQREEAS